MIYKKTVQRICFFFFGTLFLFALSFSFSNTQLIKKIRAPEIEQSKEDITPVRLLQEKEDKQLNVLKEQIEKRDQEIQKLEKQIDEQEDTLSEISGERKTLEDEVKRLNLANRKEQNQIRLVHQKIQKTNLNLNTLKQKINLESQNTIFLKDSLGDLFRYFNETEKQNPYLALLTESSVFESAQNLDAIRKLNDATVNRIQEIQKSVINLRQSRVNFSSEETHLRYLNFELRDRQSIAQFAESKRRGLLEETQKKEERYQKILDKKRQELAALINEVIDYESKIQFILDPESIPSPRKGLFRWPIGKNVRVTQLFGSTPFARKNSYLYGKPFHDGVDFGTPVGTSVVSAEDGVIVAIGNTDLVSRCRLWGKWILTRHTNGLSTLYAHLSLIKVFPGQKVKKGEFIAYSGNTGNSTGPHLHFGVYASRGIKVVPYGSFSKKGLCNGLSLPLAAKEAKIDPWGYLSSTFEPGIIQE